MNVWNNKTLYIIINTINIVLSNIIINITIFDIFNTYNNTSLLTIITLTIIIVDIFNTYHETSILTIIIGIYQSHYHIVLFHIKFDTSVIGLRVVRTIQFMVKGRYRCIEENNFNNNLFIMINFEDSTLMIVPRL